MPLLVTDAPTPEPQEPIKPVVTVKQPESNDLPYRPKYRDNTMRSEETDLNRLLQHVEGSSWAVDFYLNLNGSDQSNTGFNPDPDEGNIFQQYHRIRNMDLRVTAPLSYEYDSETGVNYFEGEANFYARVVPNEGNVIVADIGNGRRVLFEILTARPTSALKNKVYAITYRSKYEVTPEITTALNKSTVKTSMFIRESLFGLSQGLFSSEEHDIYLKAKASLSRLHEVYGRSHYVSQNNTLMMEVDNVYDPYVIAFVNSIPKDNRNGAQRYRELVINYVPSPYGTIYSELMGEFHPSGKVLNRYLLKRVNLLCSPYVYGGIAVTDIDHYVDADLTPDVPEPKNDMLETIPLYHPLDASYYVLSPDYAVYGQYMSVLEREVDNYRNNRIVDLAAVTELADSDNTNALTQNESFYYLPLVMFLLAVVIREY